MRSVHGKSYQTVTVLLWNLSGQLVGYQTWNSGSPKPDNYFSCGSNLLYGLEQLNYDDRVLYLVEGIFDAAALHRLGKNAAAVMTCNPKHLREQLMLLPFYKIALCDGDVAGRQLGKYAHEVIVLPAGQDPDSCPNLEDYL